MTDVSSNGSGNGDIGELPTGARARQVWAETGGNITGAEMARRLGIKERTASYHVSKLRKESGNPKATKPARPATRPATPKAAESATVEPSSVPRSATRKPPSATPPATPPATETATEPATLDLADRLLIWAVAAVVAVVSYSHIVDLAVAAGHGWRSYLAPVALDGLTIAAIRAQRLGRHRLTAGVGIVVGVIGSVGANVLAVRPELVDMADVSAVLAAFPPVALAVVVHLVRR